jgi:hypothetical protein
MLPPFNGWPLPQPLSLEPPPQQDLQAMLYIPHRRDSSSNSNSNSGHITLISCHHHVDHNMAAKAIRPWPRSSLNCHPIIQPCMG